MANNRIAYGLAKKFGIDTTGKSPGEVWELLKKHGVTEENAEGELKKQSEEKRESLENKYNSELEININKLPKAIGFNRPKTHHHQRHISELGYKNEREYIKGAIDFWENGKGEIYLSTKRNKYAKYDEKTGKYVVCDKAGRINTFFYIKHKRFDKYIKQEGYELWKK